MVNLNDVLLAMSNIPVDDPIAEIWGRGLQSGYKIIEYTGALPITINANGDVLLDYRIYGADGGVGEQTENLFDKKANDTNNGYIDARALDPDGNVYRPSGASYYAVSEFIPINAKTSYILIMSRSSVMENMSLCVYDSEKQFISGFPYSSGGNTVVFSTLSNYAYIRFTIRRNVVDDIMLVEGSTAPASYIPYGYKLPMTVQSTNLFDKNAQDVNKGFIRASWLDKNGNVNGNYPTFNISEFIAIKPNTNYFATAISTIGEEWMSICFYDANYNFLSGQYYHYACDYPFKTPLNAAFARASYYVRNADVAMITEGTEAPPTYIPYSKTTTPVYIGENQLGAGEYVSYSEGKIYRKNPANYFDGDFELGAINYNTGADTPSNSSIRTDFIELEPSNTYYIKWATGDLYILLVSYDENKNYVRYLGAKILNPSYIEVGANEKYIRFYLYNTITPPKEMMVCKNASAPYYDPQDPPVSFPDIPSIKGETVIDYDGDPKPSQMYVKYKGKG